jgi:hypothetical protein
MEEGTKTYRTFGETFNSGDDVLGRVGQEGGGGVARSGC